MEFCYKNYLQTTTSIIVDSNTTLAQYLMDFDLRKQYVSTGYTGSTVTTIRINFDSTQTVGRIALLSHNLKGFTVYYNGVTANTFAFTSGSATTTTDFSSNSNTSHYFVVNPVACTSVSIDLKSTIVSGQERALGYLFISNVLLDFERIPSAKDYDISLDKERVEHKMSDGTTRIQFVNKVWSSQIKFDYISQTFRDNLRDVYDMDTDFFFCPFPTLTSWDEILFPCVWSGNFKFHEYSDNAASSGFSGSINLKQTS